MTHPSPTALEEISGALDALRTDQRQLDQDGVFVGVSRQALDEVLTHIAALEAELVTQRRVGVHEICSMCGLDLRKATTECPTWHGLDHLGCDYAKKAEAQLATRLPTEAQISYLLEVLAREGVANAGGDFMRRKISKAILALLTATPAPTAALTEEELLTPELIKKAADAGERVGWDDVLTPNAQIYHRAIDLKKYETALRAVLPIIIDRLAKSPPQGAEE